MERRFEIDSLSEFDSDLWSQTMIQLRKNAEQVKDENFVKKIDIFTKKKRENLTFEAKALGLRVKVMAAENKLRQAELHVSYHQLKMEVIEFSCRERFEWMKIYSEPDEIQQFMEAFRAKLDELEKVRFDN